MAYTQQASPEQLRAASKAMGGQPTIASYLAIQADALAGDPAAQARWASIQLADPATRLMPAITKAYNRGPAVPVRKRKKSKPKRTRQPDLLFSGNREAQAGAIESMVLKGAGHSSYAARVSALIDVPGGTPGEYQQFLQIAARSGSRAAGLELARLGLA